jgi:hypothetical protein
VSGTEATAWGAAQEAMEHTRRRLFPFRFETWLVLGFATFLDQCGRQWSSPGPFRVDDLHGGGPDLSGLPDWIAAHAAHLTVVVAIALVLLVGLTALVLWINCRGIFIYMDDVATGRAEIARPWREHAERSQSLFAWRFGIAMAALVVLVLVAAVGVAVAVALRGASRSAAPLGPGLAVLLMAGAIAGLFLLFLAVCALGLVSLALRDFVAPLQWQAGVSCTAAIKLFLALLRRNPGTFVVYVLLKLVFAMALGIAFLLAGCLTCCCAFLPVVGQTVLQPFFYFERSWSLHLLRSLGHDLLPAPTPPPGPA